MLNETRLTSDPQNSDSSTIEPPANPVFYNELAKRCFNFCSEMKNITGYGKSAEDSIEAMYQCYYQNRKNEVKNHEYRGLIDELLNIYGRLMLILTNLHEQESQVDKKNQLQQLLKKYSVDLIKVCIETIQPKIIAAAESIKPSFVYVKHLEVDDLQHAYSEACIESFNMASEQAASSYENYLRICIKAMIHYAEFEINNRKMQGLIHVEEKQENGKVTEIVTYKKGTRGARVLLIKGDSPTKGGGKKSLYSVQTPTGDQCLVGYREMGDSINYCCYPMAEIDPTSIKWIKYLEMFKQHIYQTPGTGRCIASITGMHLTIPIVTPVPLRLTPLTNGKSTNRHGTQYISNGSHVSIDCTHFSGGYSPGLFRLQFRPRIEPAAIAGERFKFVLRCGRPILIPLCLSGQDRLPSDSLTQLTTVLNRKSRDGLLVREGETYLEEHKLLEEVMKSRLYEAGQGVICIMAIVGKLLYLTHRIDLNSQVNEVISKYTKITNFLQSNPNFLVDKQEVLNIVNGAPVEGLSPRPTKLLRPRSEVDQQEELDIVDGAPVEGLSPCPTK